MHPEELIEPSLLREGWVNVDDVVNQNDPFHCECRAYGRLKEEGREDLAVRCDGYVFLSSEQEDALAQRGFTDWGRRDAAKGRPIRGIVKEYIPNAGTGPFTYEMLPRMRRDIQDLNRLGIVVWDVRTDNYRAGQLVDFSQAHTAPHMELDWNSTIYSHCHIMETCVRDQACFDAVVQEWNYNNPDRKFWRPFMPNLDFGRRLRDKTRFAGYRGALYRLEGANFSAAFYDYKKGNAETRPAQAVKASESTRSTGRKHMAGPRGVRRRGASAASKKKKGKA
jgi:hypothetical protein